MCRWHLCHSRRTIFKLFFLCIGVLAVGGRQQARHMSNHLEAGVSSSRHSKVAEKAAGTADSCY